MEPIFFFKARKYNEHSVNRVKVYFAYRILNFSEVTIKRLWRVVYSERLGSGKRIKEQFEKEGKYR